MFIIGLHDIDIFLFDGYEFATIYHAMQYCKVCLQNPMSALNLTYGGELGKKNGDLVKKAGSRSGLVCLNRLQCLAWKDQKLNYFNKICRAKFSQYPMWLLSTGTTNLYYTVDGKMVRCRIVEKIRRELYLRVDMQPEKQ